MFTGHPLQRALVILVALKVAGLVLVFDPVALQAFDLPKSLFSRATEWLILGTLLLILIRFGTAVLPRDRLHLFVAAFIASVLVSLAFAPQREISLYGETDRYLGVTFVLDMAVLYAAVAIGFRTTTDWLILGGVLASASAIAYGYAFVQKLGLDPIRWSLDVRERPFSTLGHPDIFGQVLSSIFGAALAVPALTRRRAIVVAALSVAALTLVVMSFVAVRGVALGVVAAAAVAIVLSVSRSERGDRRRRVLIVSVAIGVMAIAALPIAAFTPLGERWVQTLTARASVDDRLVIYQGAIAAFLERPVAGYGPDAFAVAFVENRPENDALFRGLNAMHSSAHDWLLQTAATLGALGVLAQLALMAFTSWRLWMALPRAPLIAGGLLGATAGYWAHGLVTVGSVGVDWIPWLAAGAAVALHSASLPRQRPVRTHVLWQGALLVVAAVIATSGSSALFADHDAQRATGALGRSDPTRAALYAEAAAARDPGRASYWNLVGLTRDAQSRWRDAAAAFETAARRSPHIVAYQLNLARARARQALAGDQRDGGLTGAVDIARRAVSVDPNEPASHAVLADVANLAGDHDTAVGSALKAIQLYPWEPKFDDVLAAAAVRAKDRTAARRAIESALAIRESAVLRGALAALRP